MVPPTLSKLHQDTQPSPHYPRIDSVQLIYQEINCRRWHILGPADGVGYLPLHSLAMQQHPGLDPRAMLEL